MDTHRDGAISGVAASTPGQHRLCDMGMCGVSCSGEGGGAAEGVLLRHGGGVARHRADRHPCTCQPPGASGSHRVQGNSPSVSQHHRPMPLQMVDSHCRYFCVLSETSLDEGRLALPPRCSGSPTRDACKCDTLPNSACMWPLLHMLGGPYGQVLGITAAPNMLLDDLAASPTDSPGVSLLFAAATLTLWPLV